MKPIKLWMEGIGSYRDETCIDFSSFYSMGIYLITGDTGAGKTTIFDGMMYGLYGKASGSLRTGADLKSDYVQETVRSCVTFTFSHEEKEYTVKRLSAYKRPKKRKVGDDSYIEVSAEAEFVSEEGEMISGWDKVTQRIIELLGLSDDQFRQTVMLSQGEFAKVLSADTAERKKIFRSLFHTQLYEAYSYQVKRDVMRAREDYEKEKIKWMQYMTQLVLTEGQAERYENLDSCISQCKAEQKNGITESAKYWISKEKILSEEYGLVEKENKKQLRLLEEQRKNKAKEKESLQLLEAEARNIVKQQELLKRAVEEKADLEEQLKQKYEQEKFLLQEELEMKEAEKEIVLLQNTLPEYEKREQQKKEYMICEKRMEQLVEDEVKAVKNEVEMQERLQKIILEKENLQSVKEKSFELQVRLEKLQSQKVLNEETKQLLHDLKKKMETYEEVKEQYVMCVSLYKREKKQYDEEELKFYHGQAGLLAEKLEAGLPCPVCGSVEHPNPAPSTEVLSRQILDEKKVSLEKKHEEWTQLSKESGILCETIERDNQILYQQLEKLQIERTEDLPVQLEEQCKQVEAEISQTESAITEAKLCEERKILLETKLIPEYEQKLKSCQEALIQIRSDLAGKTAALKMQSELLEAYNKKLMYQTLEEVQKKIGCLQKQVMNFSEKKKKWQLETEELKGSIKKNSGIIETAKKTQSEKEYPDLADITLQIEGLEEAVKQLEAAHIKTYELYNSNQKLWELIRQANANAKKAESEYTTIEGVNRVVNGSLGFENFVQIAYFEQIVKEANVYLGQMTSNQYQFLRTNEGKRQNSQSGLNLLILDRYTGRKRNVTTLSGGELFKASLAMALGLSTMIQGFYGGKKIESMFVDEGFGNLDEKSLEEAVSTLRHLSEKGCLVGIISHVEKLNEWIPARIVVTRNGYNGSSVEIQN